MVEKTCFVISAIGEENSPTRIHADKALCLIIEPAVKAFGYKAIRSDKIAKPGNITPDIIQHLLNDELVVADLTGQNPNVFYELAIRHATRKPVISIIQKGEKIPFDVGDFRNIFYEIESDDDVKNCVETVKKQISTAEVDFLGVVNPVSAALDIEEFTRRKQPLERRYDRLVIALRELTGQIDELKARTPYRDLIDKYREEIDMLQAFREAGIVSTYRRREMALKKFIKAIEEETNEIVVIGSSLLGLLQKYQYKKAREALKAKCGQKKRRRRQHSG